MKSKVKEKQVVRRVKVDIRVKQHRQLLVDKKVVVPNTVIMVITDAVQDAVIIVISNKIELPTLHRQYLNRWLQRIMWKSLLLPNLWNHKQTIFQFFKSIRILNNMHQ